MAFPSTPLALVVELALDADLTADPGTWTFTDVSSYVHTDPAVSITVGSANEALNVQPGNAALRLNNSDGRFCPTNPAGAWYGQLHRNTPIRISVTVSGTTYTRFTGHVVKWPLAWDKSGNLATATITAAGVLRRLQQGNPPVKSPLRRAIEAAGPWAYWPCEDAADATQAASALSGKPAMTSDGADFAAWDPTLSVGATIRQGSAALPKLQNGSSLAGQVIPQSPASGWAVQWAGQLDYTAASVDVPIMEWATPGAGKYQRWRVVARHATGNTDVIGYDSTGAATTLLNVVGSFYSGFVEYRVDAAQNGADVNVELVMSGVVMASGTLTGVTLNGVSAVTANPDEVVISNDLVAGHVQVWDSATAPQFNPGTYDAAGNFVSTWEAYYSEAAHRRVERLCGEDGIPVTVTAVGEAYATPMFAQQDGTPLDLYRACETSDGGLLLESTDFGLTYVPRGARYNPPVALALDYAQGHIADPPNPTFDDQKLRNHVKVTRVGGSYAVAEDTASLSAEGYYADETTIQVLADGSLPDQASWRLHFGTSTDLRWPLLSWNLARNPDLIASWVACGVGSRATVDNPPSQAGPDLIDVLIDGYTETLGPYTWRVVANCSPAQPWQVWTVEGGGNTGRVDTDGSTLAADVTSTATSLSVATTTGAPLWTTAAGDFPFDINIGGERITVTSITGTSSPQTFTVTRSVNGVVKSHTSGGTVSLWRPSVIAL